LILKNPILGEFKYNLQLKGIANTSQRSLAFKCSLGQDQMQAFKFTHFMKKATNYAIKVERTEGTGVCDFKAEVATIAAPIAETYQGVELSVNIRYEPITIGDSRGILKLTSPEGLEYSCMLYGRSSAPQPQGPIKCPVGAKPAGIDFKNPLNEKVDFITTFDNPNFSLASKPAGPLDPGKVTNLQIKYDAKPDLPTTGRMLVTTKGLPPWIYYLQGE
jgi:hydrocephalus-inducing protein